MTRAEMAAYLHSIGDHEGAARYEAPAPPQYPRHRPEPTPATFSTEGEQAFTDGIRKLDFDGLYPPAAFAGFAKQLYRGKAGDREKAATAIRHIAGRLNVRLLSEASTHNENASKQNLATDTTKKLRQVSSKASELRHLIQTLWPEANERLLRAAGSVPPDEDTEAEAVSILESFQGRYQEQLNETAFMAERRLHEVLAGLERLTVWAADGAKEKVGRSRPPRHAETEAMRALNALWRTAGRKHEAETRFVAFAELCLAPILKARGVNPRLSGLVYF